MISSMTFNTFNPSSGFIETTGNIDNRRRENIKKNITLKKISIREYSKKNIDARDTLIMKIKMLLLNNHDVPD